MVDKKIDTKTIFKKNKYIYTFFFFLTVFLVIQEWGPIDPRAFTNSFTASLSSDELQPIFIISLLYVFRYLLFYFCYLLFFYIDVVSCNITVLLLFFVTFLSLFSLVPMINSILLYSIIRKEITIAHVKSYPYKVGKN